MHNKLKLRSDLRFTVREDSPHVVVEDPVCGGFHRLGIAEYRFIRSLQATDTIEDAWQHYELAQQARPAEDQTRQLTQTQTESFCQWLILHGLAEPSEDTSPSLTKPAGPAFNPFFFRRSLFNPDRWFDLASPLRHLFTWPCYVALACLAGYGLCLIWSTANEFFSSYHEIFIAHRVVAMMGMWIGLKVIHEIGHGVVCKKYGGRVPDAGIAFILLAPVAFIDVTSSWRFASRWQRIEVALAGIVVELLVATLAALVWIHSDSAFVKQCAADLILMATLSSLLFNMNPLMRFDGYFVLSDLLGIDNLYPLGRIYARYWGQKYILGLSVCCPRLATNRPRAVKAYGLAAACWRVVIVYSLIFAAAAMFHGAGIVLAAFGVAIWIIVPAVRLVRDLIRNASDGQVQLGKVLGRVSLILAFGVAVLFLIPVELVRTAPGIVEYDPPTVVRAGSDGFVAEIHVGDGETIMQGDPIITLRNEKLRLELSAIETSLALARHRARSGQWNHDSSAIKKSQSQADALKKQHQELLQQIEQLTVRAPIGGRVISRRIEELDGNYLEKGDAIASDRR